MTPKEIEKAAQKTFAHRINSNNYTIADAFKEGFELADKHWQEKTRWIPIKERLPVFDEKRRTILVKTGDNLYSFLWIIQEVSLSDFECQGYTHWKEIE